MSENNQTPDTVVSSQPPPESKAPRPENQPHPPEETPESSAADPVPSIAAPEAEREQLAQEKAELQNLLLRQRAEFENFRRRSERERQEFAAFASSEIVAELLPILDDFDRALKVEATDSDYRKGVELIHQRLFALLHKAGLEPIEAAGNPFDPNLHQAVMRVETRDAEDQIVLEEFQRGYNFKGRLLRPSMVKVAVKPSA